MRLRDKYLRFEADVLREVVLENVYRLPETFAADEVILDLGAHIGIFALECWRRGARQIHCAEPDPENYSLLKDNLRETEAICYPFAIWRFMKGGSGFLSIPSYSECWQNPAGVSMAALPEDNDTHRCQVVSLDSLIAKKHVRFLKLDVEGAEYPILLTSQRLGQVREIALEYHTMPLRVEAECEADPIKLATHLTTLGFVVTWANPEEPQGMMYAKR